MASNDDPVHAHDCPGCEMCRTFELATRLLATLGNRGADFTIEMNALIVAAGYKAGRQGDSLDSVLDAFRYAYILGRRERDNPSAGGLSHDVGPADWVPGPQVSKH